MFSYMNIVFSKLLTILKILLLKHDSLKHFKGSKDMPEVLKLKMK